MKLFKNKARIKGLLGILLIIVLLTGIYFWEDVGRENLMYQKVIVLKQDVEENTKVTKDMLGALKVDKTNVIAGAIENPDDIIGKETKHFIPRGLQLSEKFFEDPQLAIGNGRYIFSLPDTWVYSYPQSLRRGDTVYLYPIRAKLNEADPYAIMNETMPIDTPTDPIIKTKVAYVKDNSNREVTSVTEDRLDGTSVVGRVEIVVDDTEYKKLQQAYNDGYSLLILYN